MHWDMDIDICSLIILGLLGALQLSKRYMSVRRSRIFLVMVLFQAIAVFCNLMTKQMLMGIGQEPNLLIGVFLSLYYATQYVVPIFFILFMVSWSGRSLRYDSRARLWFMLPVFVYATMMIWNCFAGCLFEWDPDIGYRNSGMIWILVINSVFSMSYAIIYATVHIRKLDFAKLTILALAELGVVITMILNYMIPGYSYSDFTVSIGMLCLYFVAQNQSEIVDKSTNVLNRNMLDELLHHNINNRQDFDLIIVAMDDFKFINKTFGVTTGDMMLMQVASFLTMVTKKGMVYRYSSDQFVVELQGDDEMVTKVLNRIQERFRHPWITEEVSVMMSATICCINYPEDAGNMANIIDVIDYSVLSAKTTGKGEIVYAKNLDLHSLRKEKAIEKAVEKAIQNDTFRVYYQPIYNTEKQCYTSAEALVRIEDDLLGNIPPDVFVPISERNGMIIKFGMKIFEKVCKFISESNLKETSIEFIEVNVSVVQCMQPDFVDELLGILKKYNVDVNQINLEVTETAAANSLAIFQENIERLHAKGISLSLDDYGSGYSTLGYIHQFPFRIIKLDRLMVWDAFVNERAGITLKHTVGMLKELKVRIVAEGVETEEQRMHLEKIGCDYLQGWYYSKAIPEEEFLQIVGEAS